MKRPTAPRVARIALLPSATAALAADALRSRNDGPANQAIVACVPRATTAGSGLRVALHVHQTDAARWMDDRKRVFPCEG